MSFHPLKLKKADGTWVDLNNETDFKKELSVNYLSTVKLGRKSYEKELRKQSLAMKESGFLEDEQNELGLRWSRKIKEGSTCSLSIQWLNEEIGFGVFAEEDIEQGQFIAEYTGVIRRSWWFWKPPSQYAFRYPTARVESKNFAIDASKEGNVTRFINHDPYGNIEAIGVYLVNDFMRVILVSQRNIKEGSELSFDYGINYWHNK
ncbi:MAG: hypothetical protein CMO81_01210 [Waddliaceae bacterium]|nr:hypothetical protein [Waddliaceae bacterium]